jgi:uncharacterized protein YyaL (SSP411 family)
MKYRIYILYILPFFMALTFLGCSKSSRQNGNDPIHFHQTKIMPAFMHLPMGQIKPEGWLKAQMEGDLNNGYTGNLDSLTNTVQISIFGAQRVSKKNDIGRAWWNGETTGNWLYGLIQMAFLTDNQKAIHKADGYINYVLKYQDKDGYIGIYKPKARYNHTGENGELWDQNCIFRAMLAYYEYTGKKNVLNAVIKAVNLTMQHYGPQHSYFKGPHKRMGVAHGLMFIDTLRWLYRLTGNHKYVKFAKFLYTDFSKNYHNKMDNDVRLKFLLNRNKPLVGHTPNTVAQLRVPLWLYYATGNKVYRKAYLNGYRKFENYMVASGAVLSGNNEWIENKTPSPNSPYEYCGIFELLDTGTSFQRNRQHKICRYG